MHIAPACVGSEEVSNHFLSYVNSFLHFYKREKIISKTSNNPKLYFLKN
jgi:hypothetical protein